MSRGTQFGQLVTMFREQAGHATSRSLGQNQIPGIEASLRRIYRRLHADFNWPHLMIWREKTLSAGQQYYAYPADLDYDRLTTVKIKEAGGSDWYPLYHGIDTVLYNQVDSPAGEREDFPRAWQEFEGNQFEVWPIPESNGHTVRFYGKAAPKALTNQSDTVDLDDDLIVMYAVGEQLAREKSADAELFLKQARQHYMRLRANSQNGGPVDMRVSHDRRPTRAGITVRAPE